MTRRNEKGDKESRQAFGEGAVKSRGALGGALGPRESCHKFLPIRKRFIKAVERQKTASFSALMSLGQVWGGGAVLCGRSCKVSLDQISHT